MDLILKIAVNLPSDGEIYCSFGSCGGLIDDLPVGSLVVPKASVAVTRNLDFDFLEPPTETSHLDAYHVSRPVGNFFWLDI
jgi:uridine phosphorylase